MTRRSTNAPKPAPDSERRILIRIVVLGATGATGQEVIKQALDAGHSVVAYVRRPEGVERRPGLEVVGGQLEDVEAMQLAFQGSDAVICCVGPKLDLRTIRRSDLMQRVLPSIVAAMKSPARTPITTTRIWSNNSSTTPHTSSTYKTSGVTE